MITDKWLSRLFGLTICSLAVLVTVTACILFFREVPVPDPLDRLVTFLLGALVGRLTGSRTAEIGDSPIPTTVQNTSADPVPTSTTGPAVEDFTNPDLLLPKT